MSHIVIVTGSDCASIEPGAAAMTAASPSPATSLVPAFLYLTLGVSFLA
jgi:hypothetical protein